MGAFIGLIGTLGSIAGSLGLTKALEKIDAQKAIRANMTSAEVAGVVNEMLVEAKNKGNKIYQEVMTKLNALPANFVQSSEIKAIVQKKRKELTEKANRISEIMNNVENAAAPLNEKLNALAYSSDGYRSTTTAKKQLRQLKSQASDLAYSTNKLVEGVEKNV